MLCLVFAASAQSDGISPPRVSIERAPEQVDTANRFGLSYRMGFNLKASFKNVGVFPTTAPGPALGGVPHTYNDGAVLLDISGNAGGMTMNWRYDHASQVVGDNVVMSASNPGSLADGVNGDPQHGLELTYDRRLGKLGKCPWGLEAAFSFTDVTFRNDSISVGGPLTVDTYSLGGYPAPLAPHVGSFAGPDPVINDKPGRLPVAFNSRLDGALYGLRFGPFLDIPLSSRFDFTVSGGFALALVTTEFSFRQSVAGHEGVSLHGSGSGSESALVPGGYVAGTFTWRASRSIHLFAGVQYQGLAGYSQTVADKRAELDLRAALFFTTGLGYAF